MTEIPAKYDPAQTEDKWYRYWDENGFFGSKPDEREPYCIVIPPPNVTGVLHMGHMLNNTIQDVLVRRARMLGKNALWVPGTDHASIATEAKVVAKLKEQGIEKSSLTREEFLMHAWEWKEKHGGIILQQLRKLGASCDWTRTRFTMDPALYESVIKVFVDLYNKGLIYRGVRMINWDPQALTALSDEEVIYKEVNSKLYYVRYRIEGSEDEWLTIATTRPETILGDTAVCIHPEDERYKHSHGRKAIIPLIGRVVPIITDEYVDREFGTGCLKVTPAHDINDYNLGLKYNLEVIDIFNDNGTLNEKALLFVGEDRFVVRRKIVERLEAEGHIVKIEPYKNKVGYSERTDAVIEPKLSTQWFLKMKALAEPALEVVMNDTIKFHPSKFKNTYRHWMENVKDWCISRQLWWGHRIPAWYLPGNEVIVAENVEEAYRIAKEKYPQYNSLTPTDLRQDEDVLDTWFSSWLWPISVFDGIRYPDNPEIKYYYPTNDLVTAPEILFFWVARMIMAGLEYQKDIPFRNVYLTGIVRDKLGRKMSKQLGNSPDPIELIRKYSADGVRTGMLFTSPAGNDLPFDEALCEQGRNFANKIWNALRLVKGFSVDEKLQQPASAAAAALWFENRLNQALEIVNDHFNKYRISDALMELYRLVWEDFCSWYLEIIKPGFQQAVDSVTYKQSLAFFDKLMRMLHPFMPFITEEIWQLLVPRAEKESIMLAPWPDVENYSEELLRHFDFAREVVIQVRNFRKEKNISPKETLSLQVRKQNDHPELVSRFEPVIIRMAHLSQLEYIDGVFPAGQGFVVKSTEFFIPYEGKVDTAEELSRLEADLQYAKGFLASVMAKLSNERFMQSAPAKVIENEQKKKADAEARIKVLEDKIKALKGE
jgi:valyl-tRNA synthetase